MRRLTVLMLVLVGTFVNRAADSPAILKGPEKFALSHLMLAKFSRSGQE
jgi:hypothetical protein